MLIWLYFLLGCSILGFIGSLIFVGYHLTKVNIIRSIIGIVALLFFIYWTIVNSAGVVVLQ
ncbi:hypothetical protein ABWK22_02350 [Gottfriedia acidiceleris]|uniref:hypothetical protein n=1 Tax=Gottfriedia acidiceleris TaxID=371036 RepID=UPI003390B04D